MNFKLFTPEQIQSARERVAAWFKDNARKVRESGDYASHVTEEQKDRSLERSLEIAEQAGNGECDGQFWFVQRLWHELTGESVAFLS